MKLNISEPVRQLMERRMILVKDLERVIDWAESTGNKLVSRETGRFLAHHTLATVTYWVEYSPEDDGLVIHNTYCHRMLIVEELKS